MYVSNNTAPAPAGILQVCTDCMIARETGVGQIDGRAADLPPVWALEPTTDVTFGIAWERHEGDCPNRKAGRMIDPCECERIGHSTSPCDACGDTHHGERHLYTWWQ